MAVRVIPGAVTQSTLRALVLVRGGGAPVGVAMAPDGATTPLQIAASAPHPNVQAELARHDLTVHVATCAGLSGGTSYVLAVNAAGDHAEATSRTLSAVAPAAGLKVLVASCYYDYFSRDRSYRDALDSVWCRDAAFKLLIGDNLYMDVAPDQRDFSDGYAETVARYVRYFFESGYADVLSRVPTYTTWDDHEFWNNFPERQAHLGRSKRASHAQYKLAGKRCLKLFQASLNPPSGTNLSYSVDAPPVSFFMADLRSGRTRHNRSDRRMLPVAALDALEVWSASLTMPGVLVVGQPLWIDEGGKKDYNPPDYEDQYERIWRAIARAPFDILIVSGDVHHSRVLEIELQNGRRTPEFVTSPACHIPTTRSILWGSYSTQDRGGLEVPGSVTIGTRHGPALKPRVMRYPFGTDAQETLGVLNFRSLSPDRVSVDCTFLDFRDLQRPARAKEIEIGRSDHDPLFSRCHADGLIRLERR